jgi:hypothetical protein
MLAMRESPFPLTDKDYGRLFWIGRQRPISRESGDRHRC